MDKSTTLGVVFAASLPLLTACNATNPIKNMPGIGGIVDKGVSTFSSDVVHHQPSGLDFSKTSKRPISAGEGDFCKGFTVATAPVFAEVVDVHAATQKALSDDGKVGLFEKGLIKTQEGQLSYQLNKLENDAENCLQNMAYKLKACTINGQDVVKNGSAVVNDIMGCVGPEGKNYADRLDAIEGGEYAEDGKYWNRAIKNWTPEGPSQ